MKISKLLLILLFFWAPAAAFGAVMARGISHNTLGKDSVMQRGTLRAGKTKYEVLNIGSDDTAYRRLCIKYSNGLIAFELKPENDIAHFTFKDFNNDGYQDIVLDMMVADAGEQLLVLYEPKLKTFVFAGNCSNAEKIPNTIYFYTYQDCCVGRNWSSDLFHISSSKIINIGHIKYDDGYGLSFYKIRGKKKTLLKKRMVRINGNTPVLTGPHIDFDRGTYWARHWRTFVKD